MDIQKALDKGKGKVSIKGWVYRKRKQSNQVFLIIRDANNVIQCVIEKESKAFEDATKVFIESSIEIEGDIQKEPRAPSGYEIKVKSLNIVHLGEPYKIAKDFSVEFLADNRHLWLRSRKMTSIMKIRHTILSAFREHYTNKGYYEFTAPVLQPTQCEGGSTLFEVKYYKDQMFLSQSAQLYSEAFIMGLEKMFVIGPTFRAEKSKTSRHLCEFWMAEMEAAWMDLDQMQDDIEELLKHIVKKVLQDNKAELEILKRDISKLEPIVKKKFKRMTYTEVLDFLKKKENMEVPWGKDLRTVEEDNLSKNFDVPVIVTKYPKEIMAFYKPEDPKEKKVALCLDVIAPEGYGEIIGGSQRDLDVKAMTKFLKAEGEDPKNYEWYFDSRKYGSVPHSGHGMGVERVISWICGLDNIKDAIPFPRTMERFKP
ncbi:asparagine--tRNA ligase [archaeon]|jgi:asparaginyl-tRNA synthetase|nr:asparagine--tRNA ligase [archaeon]MBT4416822.1 asparagine--tRNA ligase [archaeon]